MRESTQNKTRKATSGYPRRLATAGIPAQGFVRLPQILAVLPICGATWWNMVRDGRAPKPVKLGPRITAWRASEIRALIGE
ncbi:MAG: AlpA family phage regulatory protein [Acidobacteria bacterium]|nr:AlpA family phage regulatory protein [Acidobacteriota bacterium]